MQAHLLHAILMSMQMKHRNLTYFWLYNVLPVTISCVVDLATPTAHSDDEPIVRQINETEKEKV